jgi:uncharacterized protein (UPF0548 family)
MIAFRSLSPDAIRHFVEEQSQLACTYREVGMTRDSADPPGYRATRHRVQLGSGEDVFTTARNAIEHWQMVPPNLAKRWMPDTPVTVGKTVAMQFPQFGMDVWCACRILYVDDVRTEDVRRFSFAYGTLPAHIASGEGRYLLEWDLQTDRVWYEIRSLAKPRFWALKLLPFMMHRNQTRYHHDSGARMQAIVRNAARLGEELLR